MGRLYSMLAIGAGACCQVISLGSSRPAWVVGIKQEHGQPQHKEGHLSLASRTSPPDDTTLVLSTHHSKVLRQLKCHINLMQASNDIGNACEVVGC